VILFTLLACTGKDLPADEECPTADLRFEPSRDIVNPDYGSLIGCTAFWCADGWIGLVPIRSFDDGDDDFGTFDDWVDEVGLSWHESWFSPRSAELNWDEGGVVPCSRSRSDLRSAHDELAGTSLPSESPTISSSAEVQECLGEFIPLPEGSEPYTDVVRDAWYAPSSVADHVTIYDDAEVWEAPCGGADWVHPNADEWVLMNCSGGIGCVTPDAYCISRVDEEAWRLTLRCPDCIQCRLEGPDDSWTVCSNVCR
jgi:hypothetical protein